MITIAKSLTLNLPFFALPERKITQLNVTQEKSFIRSLDPKLQLAENSVWKSILAKARSKFISELIFKNNLSNNERPSVLEIDSNPDFSLLGQELEKVGVATTTLDINGSNLDFDLPTFSLGVTHTLLEHLNSFESVTTLLDFMSKSSEAMVHQVHDTDVPAFAWDPTHKIGLGREEWEVFFKTWAEKNEGWTYLGNHRGINGRPANFVLEKDGSLPFYVYYDRSINRRVVNEFSLANAISLGRIPLLLTSFSIAKDNPLLLSALLGTVFALDAADGFAARKMKLGQTPAGAHIDILTDHVVELTTMFEFAYQMEVVPKSIPWALLSRNVATDFLRLYKAFQSDAKETHPHKSFGTFGAKGRAIYAGIKTLEAIAIPIMPTLGLCLPFAHLGTSLVRALPLFKSKTTSEIINKLLTRINAKKNSIDSGH